MLAQQRSDSLHQVLEQMRSLILRENLSSNNNQQDLQESIDDDQTLIPWIHQTSSSTSDDEHA